MNKYGVIVAAILPLSPLVMAEPMMYVPTGNTNEVVIIDLKTDTIVGRIDELENAHGLSGSPNSEYLVAGSMQMPKMGPSAAPEKPAAVSEAEHAAHHKSGMGGNVKSAGKSYLSLIHLKHGHVMRRFAVRGLTHHTAISPDGKIAVAVHSGLGGISIIDLDKLSVLASIDTGEGANYAVFSDDGRRLYVSNAGTNSITEIDTRTWKRTGEFKAGKAPEHMVLGFQGRFLYTANTGDASVSAIDTKSGVTRDTYAVGQKPHGIDISADGRWLFVASKQDDLITRIDLPTGEAKSVKLSPSPYHLAYLNGLNKLYVSSRREAKIWVIDPVTLAVTNTIALGRGVAHQMVIRDE